MTEDFFFQNIVPNNKYIFEMLHLVKCYWTVSMKSFVYSSSCIISLCTSNQMSGCFCKNTNQHFGSIPKLHIFINLKLEQILQFCNFKLGLKLETLNLKCSMKQAEQNTHLSINLFCLVLFTQKLLTITYRTFIAKSRLQSNAKW